MTKSRKKWIFFGGSSYQSPRVERESVLSIDISSGGEDKVGLETIARSDVHDGVHDLVRVGGGFLLEQQIFL